MCCLLIASKLALASAVHRVVNFTSVEILGEAGVSRGGVRSVFVDYWLSLQVWGAVLHPGLGERAALFGQVVESQLDLLVVTHLVVLAEALLLGVRVRRWPVVAVDLSEDVNQLLHLPAGQV
jgi:hypothetical protein